MKFAIRFELIVHYGSTRCRGTLLKNIICKINEMTDSNDRDKEENLVTYITEDLIKRTTKTENLRDVVVLSLHRVSKHKIKVISISYLSFINYIK